MSESTILGRSVATAALAGLLFGFDTAVIAGVTADLTRVFALSPGGLGITVSSALWGTLAGALFAGKPGDRYGSRDALRVLALFYLVSGVGTALAWSWESFLLFRFIGGLAIGGSSVLAPVYIAEIAPPATRGLLVGLFQFNIVFGILVAYLSNALVAGLDVAEVWRWKLGATVLPALLFAGFLAAIPHSPRWLATRGRTDEAEAARLRIGLPPLEHVTNAPAERLSWTRHRRPILLAVALATFNQLAGINAILYYANDIFASAGYGDVSANMQAVAIGAANLAFTMLGMLLIDRVGRKRLLVVGAAGMTVCLTIVALVLLGTLPQSMLLAMLVGFIAFFAVSQGAVIWVYLSEIFPTPVRARGSGLGASVHWLMTAIISGIFPAVTAISTAAPFLFFAAMMAVQCVVVALFFPETKGVTLEHMDAAVAR